MALSDKDLQDKIKLRGSKVSETVNAEKNATIGGADLKAFGMKDLGDVGDNFNKGAAGKGDGTYQLGSGGAYFTDKDFDKFRGSSEFKDLATKIHGADVVAKKLEDGGEFSDSFMDSTFDRAADEPEMKQFRTGEEEYRYSPRIAKSIAYVDNMHEHFMDIHAGKGPGTQAFKDSYQTQLKDLMFKDDYKKYTQQQEANKQDINTEAPVQRYRNPKLGGF